MSLQAEGRSWWREPEIAWLLVLVVVAYFLRAGDLPLRGEEPTRAQIAREMAERHDWIVPREQGEPFGYRPPLQNWAIAASCQVLGNWDRWAVRFHSLLATLLTTLLTYGYARTFLSRLGALSAAAAFATMGDMMQMGRQAETEALFTLLVGGSLLVWHWGHMRRWPAGWTYAAGYALMALAMLTKGIQAPTYFLGTITLYLVITRQWGRLFCRAHLWGALAGVAVLMVWIIPYGFVQGWSAVPAVWFGDPAITYNGGISSWKFDSVASHWLTFPLEIAAGTMPWSLLLLFYFHKGLRRAISAARPNVVFLCTCLAVAFPTCWLPPGGLPRYFAPLFPILAVLIGLVVQRCSEADPASTLRRVWHRYLMTLGCVMFLAALALMAIRIKLPHPALAAWVGPPLTIFAYAAASVAAAALLIFWVRRGEGRSRWAVLTVAGFMVLVLSGAAMDVRVRKSEDADQAMARLKERLPAGQKLVSLNGHAHELFSYLYGTPLIVPHNAPITRADEAGDLTYFCIWTPGDQRPRLPFAWEEIGVVPVDRNHHATPEEVVVVGRRLPEPVPYAPYKPDELSQ